jgi:putative transposase
MGFAYRISEQSGVYFITCTVSRWVDVYSRSLYADIVVDSLRYCQLHKGLKIYGWVIMTNHIHLIVSSEVPHRLSDVLRDFKKFTASKILDRIKSSTWESRKAWMIWLFNRGGNQRFWKPGFHPKEIHTQAFFEQKLEYIHLNPVRAGLVDTPEAWRYSSARDFAGRRGLIALSDFG